MNSGGSSLKHSVSISRSRSGCNDMHELPVGKQPRRSPMLGSELRLRLLPSRALALRALTQRRSCRLVSAPQGRDVGTQDNAWARPLRERSSSAVVSVRGGVQAPIGVSRTIVWSTCSHSPETISNRVHSMVCAAPRASRDSVTPCRPRPRGTESMSVG